VTPSLSPIIYIFHQQYFWVREVLDLVYRRVRCGCGRRGAPYVAASQAAYSGVRINLRVNTIRDFARSTAPASYANCDIQSPPLPLLIRLDLGQVSDVRNLKERAKINPCLFFVIAGSLLRLDVFEVGHGILLLFADSEHAQLNSLRGINLFHGLFDIAQRIQKFPPLPDVKDNALLPWFLLSR